MLGIIIEIIFGVLVYRNNSRRKVTAVVLISAVVLGMAAVVVARNVSV